MQGPLCHSANGNSPAWVSMSAIYGLKRKPDKVPRVYLRIGGSADCNAFAHLLHRSDL
jgi:hypothetical protein